MTTTCKDCFQFISRNDGTDKGHCNEFNRSARQGHSRTSECPDITQSAYCQQNISYLKDLQSRYPLPCPVGSSLLILLRAGEIVTNCVQESGSYTQLTRLGIHQNRAWFWSRLWRFYNVTNQDRRFIPVLSRCSSTALQEVAKSTDKDFFDKASKLPAGTIQVGHIRAVKTEPRSPVGNPGLAILRFLQGCDRMSCSALSQRLEWPLAQTTTEVNALVQTRYLWIDHYERLTLTDKAYELLKTA